MNEWQATLVFFGALFLVLLAVPFMSFLFGYFIDYYERYCQWVRNMLRPKHPADAILESEKSKRIRRQ
jgi:hypothetical protein